MPGQGAKTSCPLPSVTSGDAALCEANRRKGLICSGWYGATIEDTIRWTIRNNSARRHPQACCDPQVVPNVAVCSREMPMLPSFLPAIEDSTDPDGSLTFGCCWSIHAHHRLHADHRSDRAGNLYNTCTGAATAHPVGLRPATGRTLVAARFVRWPLWAVTIHVRLSGLWVRSCSGCSSQGSCSAVRLENRGKRP